MNTIEAATNLPETVRVWGGGPAAGAQLIRDSLAHSVPWGPLRMTVGVNKCTCRLRAGTNVGEKCVPISP